MGLAGQGRVGVHLTRRNDGPIVRRLMDLQGWLSGVCGARRGNSLWGVPDECAARNGFLPMACPTGVAFAYDAN